MTQSLTSLGKEAKMIDQSHATARRCDNELFRNLNAIKLTRFGVVISVLVISGCSTDKGARSASKSTDKNSIVSKYLPADKKVATTKQKPTQDKGLGDESLVQRDDDLIRPVGSVQGSKTRSAGSIPKEEKTAEFTDLFNRGADDKSRNSTYDAD
jgi:hypothetical protein